MKFMSRIRYFSLLIAFFYSALLTAQEIYREERSDLPESISNNAVVAHTSEGQTMVYTFGGISDINSCGTPHLRSYKYDVTLDKWSSIPPIPDTTGGVIAAGASSIKDKIYIVGGYQVREDCSEYTSPFFHAFDPISETYERLPDVPVPVDDHVQLVWRDSLLILVTGWSTSRNVVNVQIYDPTTNVWTEGSPIPNSSKWRVFGASGSIIGDTLYFMGGAGPTCNSSVCFPATEYFRKGYINPNKPTEIEWIGFEDEKAKGYRMAASTYKGQAIWFGGANSTYNFDAIDYNSNEVVQPNQRISVYRPETGQIEEIQNVFPAIMDMRGLAKLVENEFIFVGGIGRDQEVLDKTVLLRIERLTTGTQVISEQKDFAVFPNPSASTIYFDRIDYEGRYKIFDISGNLVKDGAFTSLLDVSNLNTGRYQVILENAFDIEMSSFIKY